jgi:CRP-like cAMP-binding protein
VLYDIIYNCKPKYYNPGDTVQRASYKTRAEAMFIVERGEIEVFTECEGNEFVLDRLHSGSIVNFRTFLMDDLIQADMRCTEGCKVLELSLETL